MYPHQRERLTHVLERDGLAALGATSPVNLAYVAGEEPVAVRTPRMLLVTSAAAALVAHARDTGHIEADHALTYTATPADVVGAALDRLGVGRGAIALEAGGLSARDAAAVTAALAPRTVRSGNAAWRAARAVKSPFEIECLERGLVILEEALNALVQVLVPGMTPKEAVAVCQAHAARHGMALERAVVTAGKSGRAFRQGDQIGMELAGRWKGYHAIVARSGVLGAPTAAQEAGHAAVEASLSAAFATLHPGARARDIFAAFAHGAVTGHGLGLEPDEAPALTGTSDDVVETDMVLALAAGGGPATVRLVDTVFVGARGARRLNRTQAGLVTLD